MRWVDPDLDGGVGHGQWIPAFAGMTRYVVDR